MTDAIFNVPHPVNEPIWNYAPGSPEKLALKKALAEAKAESKRRADVHRWQTRFFG
jgi:1-pyrroline-5-carboxylate dehydrogenase